MTDNLSDELEVEYIETPIRSYKMNTDEITIPTWETPPHKITKAFNDGKKHAINHWFGEEANPDWPYGVKSWAINPYAETRPAAYHCWIAGFCEQWAKLVRGERDEKNHK